MRLYLKQGLIIFLMAFLLPFESFSQKELVGKNQDDKSKRKTKRIEKKWNRERINVKTIDIKGREYEGQLLYAVDSFICLYVSYDLYQPNLTSQLIVKLDTDEIDSLSFYRKSQFTRGFLHGIFVGLWSTNAASYMKEANSNGIINGSLITIPASIITGSIIGLRKKINLQYNIIENIDIFSQILPVIKEYSIFPEQIPQELIKYGIVTIEKDTTTDVAKNIDIKSNQNQFGFLRSKSQKFMNYNVSNNPFYISKIHMSSCVAIFTNVPTKIRKGYKNSDFNIRESRVWSNKFNIAYRINKKTRLGIETHRASYIFSDLYDEKIGDIDYVNFGINDEITKKTYNITLDYIFNPVKKRISDSKIEFILGGGFSYNNISISQHLQSYYYQKIYNTATNSTTRVIHENYLENNLFDKDLMGINARAGIDYYLTRNLSVQFRIDTYLLSKISVNEITITNEILNLTKTVSEHDVNLSSYDVLFGLHIHF